MDSLFRNYQLKRTMSTTLFTSKRRIMVKLRQIIMLSLLGSSEKCTPTLVSESARIYSLPTHKYNHDASQVRRYKEWLRESNNLIKGFTEYDNKYYMVVDKHFYYCYLRTREMFCLHSLDFKEMIGN